MTEPVISIRELGKRYKIGVSQGTFQYKALRDSIANILKSPFNLLSSIQRKSKSSKDSKEFWALKDISFDVQPGEVLGIIGRNGAGKTTLLKILSRITEPTEGEIRIRGRVASLLEVGTGFHPELTGRENIFMNGAILGMTRREIIKKFDEIVSFAEVEKFIDTPVKRYSSGMYVRLAFAVAAHLEPEILLVDEVLAVGDAAFQKKCMGKMGDVVKGGRTVLFVSHNMAAINRLCIRTMCLSAGHILMQGATGDVVSAYLAMGSTESGEVRWGDLNHAPGDEHIRLRAVRIIDSKGDVSTKLDIRLPFHVEIEYEILRVLSTVRTGFRIITPDGTVVFTSSDTNDSSWEGKPRSPGTWISRCEIPGNLLNEGQYSLLNVWADIPLEKVMFLQENLLSFHIEQTGGVSGRYPERWSGVICPSLSWNISVISEKI